MKIYSKLATAQQIFESNIEKESDLKQRHTDGEQNNRKFLILDISSNTAINIW